MSEVPKQYETRKYEPGTHPDLPPPPLSSGPALWVKEHLLGSPTNIVLTCVSLYLLYQIIPGLWSWAFSDAVFSAGSRNECRDLGSGACWAFIDKRVAQFVYGFYPQELRWRVNLSFLLLFAAVIPVLFDKVPARGKWLMFSVAYPFIAYVLLVGNVFGLEHVETSKFGGFMLTMVIGITGIAASLPIGILLALGRRSDMPAVRILCVMFIEFIRGVPLITLLFVASTMLTYFLPPGSTFDLLARVLIMVTLFSAGYLAEVVRGGLQALPKGQMEAANALGLRYWQAMRLIILPQALKISIPGIVNTFIGLFKDTTLVIIIGLLDPLGIGQASLADAKWNGLSTEVYVFIAIFFFICCFSMSRYSLYLERKLDTGYQR
ncbi:MAG: ABC transporter permease subunit [Gammaproteobacteria bacterium]|nr:ABC transporter permease subunit [Gammaproteobacteria bacterium]